LTITVSLSETKESSDAKQKYICLNCGHTFVSSKAKLQCFKCRSGAIRILYKFDLLTNEALKKFSIQDIASFTKVYNFLKDTDNLDQKQPDLNKFIEAFVNTYGILWENKRRNPHIVNH
jgi:DNA-directed RNA polymerase subunit RPC12/RpoP